MASKINASLKVFLFLSRYIAPRPALTASPVNRAPNGIPPKINSSVMSTLDAQLGIKPTTAHTSGVKYVD